MIMTLPPAVSLLMERPTPPRAVPRHRHSDGVYDTGRTLASMDFNMLFAGGGSADQASSGDQKQSQLDESSGYDTVTVYIRILRRLTAPRTSFEYQLAQTLKSGLQKLGRCDAGDDAHVQSLKEYVTANGFAVNVSTTPGACGSAALLNLRHTFLWLKPPVVLEGTELKQQRIIIELGIKAHFIISRATPNYQRLVDALPEHFVGTYRRLVELVEFMCEQMTASFRESGMSIPPWRQPKSILSKWYIPTVSSDAAAHGAVTPESKAPAYVATEEVVFESELGDETNS